MKVTIEIEGTSPEVERWLQARFGANAELASEDTLGWSPEVADRLVARITPDARKALRYLMENGPEILFEDLQNHLGMNGIRTGGVMASFGFAVNAGFPRPYVVDRGRRRYVVDPEVAPILLDALNRFEERHGRAT